MQMDMVCFRLPGHSDAALRNMNSLREQRHFCDITIVAGGRQMFRGHKVVLAAGSAFLRDQFLLNPSAELQVWPYVFRFQRINDVASDSF